MAYQLTSGETILRLSDNAFVPADPGNSDYRQYLDWVAEGNTPEPAPSTPKPNALTAQEKLAATGLTVDELKSLLGLSE